MAIKKSELYSSLWASCATCSSCCSSNSDIDAEIAELESQLAKTHALKQGMMQKLLTGEIRLL